MASLTIEERITQMANRHTGVKRVTTADGVTTDEHPIRDNLEMIRFLATQEAFKNGFTGIRSIRLPGSTPGGACGS